MKSKKYENVQKDMHLPKELAWGCISKGVLVFF
jgi:hypothetical protein